MAKIYLIDEIGRGGVARTDALILGKQLANLDWNADEQLIGIEIGLAALPQEARELAEDITFRSSGDAALSQLRRQSEKPGRP